MKIAVARDKNYVSPHFGHCEGFDIFNIYENKIADKSFLPNPGHKPGFLPVFLKERGIDVIIAGGMGGTAQEFFKNSGIQVFLGIEGFCKDVVQKYLNSSLESTNSICLEHQHKESCGS